jgi:hypothetical protein
MDLATTIALNLLDTELNSARLALGAAQSHLEQAERMAALHQRDTVKIGAALLQTRCAIEHLAPEPRASVLDCGSEVPLSKTATQPTATDSSNEQNQNS